MTQAAAWTDTVSDHVMDAQVIAKEMVMADGVVTETEQRLLDALYQTQECITDVDKEMTREVQRVRAIAQELTGIATVIRTGETPGRLRALRDENAAA